MITQTRRTEGVPETTANKAELSEVFIKRSPEGTASVMRYVPR